jgi:hypothetical protein
VAQNIFEITAAFALFRCQWERKFVLHDKYSCIRPNLSPKSTDMRLHIGFYGVPQNTDCLQLD